MLSVFNSNLSTATNHIFRLQPANITRDHFVLGQKESGEYAGRRCLELRNHVSEKVKKLSLSDYNCRKTDGQFDMIDYPKDKFNVVALWCHIEKHFMPPRDTGIEVGRFFRRHAFDKDMKVSFNF